MTQGRRDVVLLDLDGTVLDTYAAILDSLQYATKTVLGAALPDDELVSMVGQPLVTQMRVFAQGDEDLAQRLLVTYRAYNEEGLDERISPFAGIPEALAALRERGFTVGVVTSKRRGLAEQSLIYFGLREGLACVRGVEDSTAHKPDPDPLLRAADALAADASRCLYVGDSPFDIQAAHAADMPCVGVTWGKFFARDRLEPERPSVLIDDPAELVGAVLCAAQL